MALRMTAALVIFYTSRGCALQSLKVEAQSMLILSNEDIEKLLPVGACLEVLEEAYRDLGNGMAATVPRYDVFSPTSEGEFYEYKTMSGVLPNRRIAALRLNSSVVKWYEKAGGVRKDKLPVAGGDRYVGLEIGRAHV